MLKRLLKHLWQNEDGFFGIGLGPSKKENNQYGDTANLANFATSEGESNTSKADNFWSSILSGNPGDLAKALGPAFGAINQQTQQAKKTANEFGNRGGGTNAYSQTLDDNARKSSDSMISSLTGQAAGALGASGQGLLSTGLSAHDAAFGQAKTIQEQEAAKIGDIFKSISSIASSVFSPSSGLFGKGSALSKIGQIAGGATGGSSPTGVGDAGLWS